MSGYETNRPRGAGEDKALVLDGIRCFVTGGAGFIGSHLTDRLLETCTVTVYDNLSSGRIEFLQHHLGKPGFRFVKGDLLDPDLLLTSMGGHDVIFHLGANPDVRAGSEKTDLDLQQGTVATYNLLEAMRLNQVSRMLFASSGAVYGEAAGAVAENAGPLLPISLYGAGKLASEGLISAFCHLFDMQAWIFRFANVVGARCNHGVIFDFINKLKRDQTKLEILGDGSQCKPYLHVADCVDGMLFALRHCRDRVNVLNLGSDSATDVKSIAAMLVEALGLTGVEFMYTGGERGWRGDVPQVRFDTRRMYELGWKPKCGSDDAVATAIRDLLDQV